MPHDAVVDRAIEDLIGGESLAGKQVLVLLPDRTRPFPLESFLAPLAFQLLAAGLSEEGLVFGIASGTHVPEAADRAPLEGILPEGAFVLDPLPEEHMALVGTTSRGTPVSVHPALLEFDLVLSLDMIALHYFAGFGGGGKMLFPGLGARASIAANHRLSLAPQRGLASGVEPGRTHDNPVARDLREAHELLPRARHLTLVPSVVDGSIGMIVWSDYAEFDRECAAFADRCRVGTRHDADLVMAIASGPTGIDLVQAHKALFHAALYARDGADVILIAECPEGIGSPSLARWLERPDRDRLEADARSAYDLNAQTAISLVSIAERTRVTLIAGQPLPSLAHWGIEVVSDASGVRARVERAAAEGRKVVRLDDPTRRLPAA